MSDAMWDVRMAAANARRMAEQESRESHIVAEAPPQQSAPPEVPFSGPSVLTDCQQWFVAGRLTREMLDKAPLLTDEMVREADAAVKKADTNRGTKDRLWMEFVAFVTVNPSLGVEHTGRCLSLFLESKVPRVKYNSLVTYGRHLRSTAYAEASDRGVSGMRYFSLYMKRLEICAMHQVTEHAPRVTDHYIIQLLGSEQPVEVRTLVWVMVISACRHDDLMNLVKIVYDGRGKALSIDWGKLPPSVGPDL
jgi:hypothetical protein